jgi:predicted transcriptional regulator
MAALLQMMNVGMTASAIADAAGVSENTVSNWLAKLRSGRTFTLGALACSRLINAKIPETGKVGTTGPRRMLRALARIGWSCEELTRRVNANGRTIGEHTLWSIRSGRTERVRAWVANEITALYRELQMTPGGSEQTVRLAIANDWASPLAWDDDAIDDPAARPVGVITAAWDPAGHDDARIERRINGDRTIKLHKGESVEVVRRMLATGHTQTAIRRITGLKPERYTAEIRATRELEEVA